MTGSVHAFDRSGRADRRGKVIGFGSESLRSVLRAAASPGAIVTIGRSPSPANGVSAAAYAACSALMDSDGRLWLSSDLRRNAALLAALRFQCGATGGVHSGAASSALLTASEWDGPDRFRYGDTRNPHASTTVIIEVDGLRDTGGVVVHRDGDHETRRLDARGLDDRFWLDVNRNFERAPYGIDFVLACRDRLVAITRNCFVTPC